MEIVWILLCPMAASAAMAAWIAAIALYRKGVKGWPLILGLLGGLCSLSLFCLAMWLILPYLPAVERTPLPTPPFDYLPV